MRKPLPVAVTGRRRWRRSSGCVFVCGECGKGGASGQDVRAWNSGPQETREKDKTSKQHSTSPRFYLHTKARTGHGVQSLEVPTECLSFYLSLVVCPELLGVYQALHYAFCWLHQSCMPHRRISLHTHAAKVHQKKKQQQSQGYTTFLCDLITQRESEKDSLGEYKN